MGDLIPFPRPVASPFAPPLATTGDGYPDGTRIVDQVDGRRGTVRGRYWGTAGIAVGRPLRYAVAWDDDPMLEAVVACRIAPLVPALAPRGAGPSLTTLNLRRLLHRPPPDDPKGVA